jgi:hypothetical protein
VILPLGAIGAALALWRGWLPVRTWAFVVALNALLVGSAWLAIETGEREEERVEEVAPETAIERHEQRAEAFLWLSAASLAVAGAGLLAGRRGEVARAAAVAASLDVLGAGVRVGHTGGELVYVHGAASAYAPCAGPIGDEARLGGEAQRDDDD